jgi:hypothetical protein
MVMALIFEQQKLPKSTGTLSASVWAKAAFTRSLEVIVPPGIGFGFAIIMQTLS